MIIESILYLFAYLILEPVKRLVSPFMFPIAYLLRRRLRTDIIVWAEYLYAPKHFFLWFFLDDSVKIAYDKEYADKEKYYLTWFWNLQSPFLLAWYWAAIRNSCVNWNNLNAFVMGDFLSMVKHYGNDRNFYEIRGFTGGNRPYIEFWAFGFWFQFGWIRRGRFEIDLFKCKG